MMSKEFPARFAAIKVEQPLGFFYVASIPARVLLQVAYSDTLYAALSPGKSGYEVKGIQRPTQDQRLNQIADYIDRQDSAFPNSIILAANFGVDGIIQNDDEEDEEQSREWVISEGLDGCFTLVIPTEAKLAAVVDGQHRLFAFARTAEPDRLNMELPCSIYLDLPKPFQAQLFATINSNQKPVDKSLTYELFGYNLSEESEPLWTPDKLAVFLTRKLNTESESALYGRIIIAPRRDSSLDPIASRTGWKVSTAVVVEGILRLITSNPKRDTNEMRTHGSVPRRSLEGKFSDKSPLRDVYLKGNDRLIYKMVLNYLRVCDKLFWERAKPESFIFKTSGVQALFAILRRLARDAAVEKDISADYFQNRLAPAANIDFSEDRFRSSSGAGRSLIRREIENAIGLE